MSVKDLIQFTRGDEKDVIFNVEGVDEETDEITITVVYHRGVHYRPGVSSTTNSLRDVRNALISEYLIVVGRMDHVTPTRNIKEHKLI
jgi:hypothetical protein